MANSSYFKVTEIIYNIFTFSGHVTTADFSGNPAKQ